MSFQKGEGEIKIIPAGQENIRSVLSAVLSHCRLLPAVLLQALLLSWPQCGSVAAVDSQTHQVEAAFTELTAHTGSATERLPAALHCAAGERLQPSVCGSLCPGQESPVTQCRPSVYRQPASQSAASASHLHTSGHHFPAFKASVEQPRRQQRCCVVTVCFLFFASFFFF